MSDLGSQEETNAVYAERNIAVALACHTCGAMLDGDALAVQMAADGSPKLDVWYCAAHLIAGLERLKAALRAQSDEGEA